MIGPCLVLLLVPDTPGCEFSLAGCFAALRGGLAFIDAAGEPIDQPHAFLGRTVDAHEPRADSRDQRGQQNGRRDHGCADQDGHRICRTIGQGPAVALIFALSFR